MEKRTYYAPDIDTYALAQSLYDWFVGQNYQTQLLPSESGAVTVQAAKAATLRSLTGTSSALTAVITFDGENVLVEMGNAKWTDKAAVAAAGVLIFPPALIAAGIGVFQQSQLQSNAWKYIEQYVRSNSAFTGQSGPAFPRSPAFPQSPQMPRPAPAVQGGKPAAPPPINLSKAAAGPGNAPVVLCVSCHQPLRSGAKFCDNCGAPAPVSHTCRSCNKPLRPGARFCDECGTPV